jgi:undecaprenyl-diphosphatase
MSRSGAPSTAILALAGIAIVVGLAGLVFTGASRGFDTTAMAFVRSEPLRDPLAFLRVVTEAGSTSAVMILAAASLLVGLAIGPWRHGVIAAVVVGLASLGNGLLKAAIARERPDLIDAIVSEAGYSFPSGHSALGMVGWGILAVLVSRTRLPRAVRMALVAGMAVMVVLIGTSRVYLGVHYPTDVIAGWTLGGVIVLLYERLTRTVSREPAAAAVDADPAAPRSDPPAAG